MLKNVVKKIMPGFLVSWYHFILAFFGALVYGFPSRKLIIIGITGTHGKTTVVELISNILEQAGHKTATSSSIKFKIAGKERENKLKMTMPGRARLQKFLRDARRAGCKCAVLEATSEGVLQHRHRFINFDVMVFTNLFKEHIERHGSFENYKKAKQEYFKKCKGAHIINIDDKNAEHFLRFSAKTKYGFAVQGAHSQEAVGADVKTVIAKNPRAGKRSIRFSVGGIDFEIALAGKFNIYNALAAICIGLSQGISLEVCKKALDRARGVPGRMEEVIASPFRVVVDYAFTPDALSRVYAALKPSPLVCVLGACGGGRDKWKRKELGRIAGQQCKEVIVTNEDPYDENPMAIINDVAGGAIGGGSGAQTQRILDRRTAIKTALLLAQPGSTVIITGKGCEPWICAANGKKIPWDDRQIVREEFANLTNQ